MVELAGRARLGDEAKRRVLVREQVRVDDLDRDRAPERALLGAVDAAHAADADQVEDVVAARQRPADELVLVVRADRAHREAAGRAVQVLDQARGSALGACGGSQEGRKP